MITYFSDKKSVLAVRKYHFDDAEIPNWIGRIHY